MGHTALYSPVLCDKSRDPCCPGNFSARHPQTRMHRRTMSFRLQMCRKEKFLAVLNRCVSAREFSVRSKTVAVLSFSERAVPGRLGRSELCAKPHGV